MPNVLVEEAALASIAQAIREKTRKTETMKPGEMADEISSITPILSSITITDAGEYEAPADIDGYNHIKVDVPPAPPAEAFTYKGNRAYAFSGGQYDWFLDANMDKITTKDLTDTSYMFSGTNINKPLTIEINYANGGCDIRNMFQSSKFTTIPSIDFNQTSTYRAANYVFYNSNVEEIGTLKNLYPSELSYFFSSCKYLRYLPAFEGFNLSRMKTYAYCSYSGMFQECYSLREIPEELLKQLYGIQNSPYYLIWNYLSSCYVLDEIKGLSPQTGELTSNSFTNSFYSLYRIKDLMFAVQEDGTPYSAKWKSQTINLKNIGYISGSSTSNLKYMTGYNSGITADKEVVDDATYQALKDDPDWFTQKYEYSRYNHDSAVNTINSLPIITATATTNTIQFTGASGKLTDGGAINTLTAEEIAVAAAKGWTVTYA